MKILNLSILIGIFFLSLSLNAQERHSGVEVKLIKGKIMLYREGVHFQFDGKKMLRTDDVLQTMGESTITIEYRNFQVTLAPFSFFKIQAQQNKKHVMIGKLLYGSIHTSYQVVRTDKPYQVYGHHFTATMSRSAASFSIARSRRELIMMSKGNVSGAPEILKDIKEIENSANQSTQVAIMEGPVTVTLEDKKERMLNSGQSLEFRAEGIGEKVKEMGVDKVKAMFKQMNFNLPFL